MPSRSVIAWPLLVAAALTPLTIATSNAASGRGSAVITRSSAIRYTANQAVAIVRVNKRLRHPGDAFFAGPALKVGQRVGQNTGPDEPTPVGLRRNNCYLIALARLTPVETPRPGATWRIALVGKAGPVITSVRSAPVARRVGTDWQTTAITRLGCTRR